MSAAARVSSKGPKDFDPNQLVEVLNRLADAQVVVVGDVGVDRYTFGKVERISPEAPVPILQVTEQRLKLGMAANVVDNIAALDGKVQLVGMIGEDPAATTVEELLFEIEVSSKHLIRDKKRPTIVKERVVTEQQQLLRIDYEQTGEISAKAQAQLLQKVKALLKGKTVLVIEDYAKGLLNEASIQKLIDAARKAKIPVLVDPNAQTPLTWYKGATLLTPNSKEAERLSGIQMREDGDLLEAGKVILAATQANAVLLTLGKDGMALFQKGKPDVLHLPTSAQEVYDVSGAGDTVIAVLAMGLSVGASFEQTAVLANIAAGIEVGKQGTATVTREELFEGIVRWAGGAGE